MRLRHSYVHVSLVLRLCRIVWEQARVLCVYACHKGWMVVRLCTCHKGWRVVHAKIGRLLHAIKIGGLAFIRIHSHVIGYSLAVASKHSMLPLIAAFN